VLFGLQLLASVIWGQHHARLLASLDGVELVGICDTNSGRAADIAAKFGGQVFADARDLLSRVDAVTVAVPTVSHVDVALPFLDAGIATLVEKPIAPSVHDADRLVNAAERGGALLATGHTERFNPAVATALPLICEPRFIEIHRLGTFPERKPRHRRHLRSHDSRSASPPQCREVGGRRHRSRRRQRAHAQGGHRECSHPLRIGLHRECDCPAGSAASASARRGFSRTTPTCPSITRLRSSKCSG
jgi:hypothetical protein